MAGTSDVVRENESVHARPISRQSHSTGMVEERVKAKILVVDDDPGIRQLLQLHLAAANYQVTSVETSSEAVEQVTAEIFDLAIVDLQSQKIDSLELAKRWRSDPRLSTIPLIGFFSHVEIELQRSALAAGFDRVLPRSQFSRDLAAIISGNTSTSGTH